MNSLKSFMPCAVLGLGLCGGMLPAIVTADPAADLADLALIYGGAENVSIATGSAKPLRLAPAVASVITAEEIAAFGVTTLDEALTLVPGFYVGISPFNRLNPNWSIRGIVTDQTPQVLLLRDGIPITHFFNGARPNLFQLSLTDVARIEVIRGPGSAIYGADAFAGVVNVITRAPNETPGWRTGVRAGSFEHREAWLQQAGRWGDWDAGFNLTFTHTAGDQDRVVGSDLQSVFDTLFLTQASQTPGALATGYDALNASLQLRQGGWTAALWHWRLLDAGVGAGAAQALDPEGSQTLDLTQVDIGYRREAADWSSDLRLVYRELHDYPKFTLFPAGAVLPIGTDGNIGSTPFGGLVAFTDGVLGRPAVHDQLTSLEWVAHYTGSARHHVRLALGVKQERERVEEQKNFGPGVLTGTEGVVDGTLSDVTDTENVFLPNRQRTVSYLSLQDEWKLFPDWELTAGLRYDHYSDFGSIVNPRLVLVWSARHDLVAKLLYGRAFRAPSFGEQYARNNPVVLGNPDLEPESIDSYELALDYRPRPELNARLNFFRYDISDLIDYVPDANGQSSTARNVQDRQGHGLEFELAWQAADALRLEAGYAWQESENKATGRRVANTPRQMASLRTTWQLAPAWTLASQTFWLADFARAADDPRPALEDYSLTHLTLRHPLRVPKLEFRLALRNVFDQDARAPTLYNAGLGTAGIPEDYPLPGRSFWLELRYGD